MKGLSPPAWLKPMFAVAACAVLVAALGGVALGEATNGGAAVIVNPATNEPQTAGGSDTVWTFKLPAPPASNCSGDSASDAFFVYSYITPTSNDPGELTFNPSEGPEQPAGSFAWPLFEQAGSAYISRNTAPETGQVKDFPATQFDFRRFSIDGRSDTIPLPAGAYNVGISCWDGNNRVHDKYWNGVVTFVANATDPNGETWFVGDGPPPSSTTSTTELAPTTTSSSTPSSSTTSTTEPAPSTPSSSTTSTTEPAPTTSSSTTSSSTTSSSTTSSSTTSTTEPAPTTSSSSTTSSTSTTAPPPSSTTSSTAMPPSSTTSSSTTSSSTTTSSTSTTPPPEPRATVAGDAVIVDPTTGALMMTGGSATRWRLRLEPAATASCSGGSAVYSFITPEANDPAALRFDPQAGPDQPTGSFAHPLHDVDGAAFVSRDSIDDLATVQFDFARFSPDGRDNTILLPPGGYRVGIACWDEKNDRPDKVWDPRVTFSASSSDRNGFVWTASLEAPASGVTAAPALPLARTGVPIVDLVIAGAGAIAVGAGAIVATRLRRWTRR